MSNEGWIYIGLRFFLHHGAENYAFRPRDEPEPDKTASDQEYGDGSGVPFSLQRGRCRVVISVRTVRFRRWRCDIGHWLELIPGT